MTFRRAQLPTPPHIPSRQPLRITAPYWNTRCKLMRKGGERRTHPLAVPFALPLAAALPFCCWDFLYVRK